MGTVVPAVFPQPLLPLPARALERPEIVDFVLREAALDLVPHAELFVGIFHRPVQIAGVNLLVDIVQRIFDHLQLVLGGLRLGNVAADAKRMSVVEGHVRFS